MSPSRSGRSAPRRGRSARVESMRKACGRCAPSPGRPSQAQVWRLFAPGLHRRVLLGQRGAQRRNVVEDEIERGVEQPAGAYGRLDEPFWKFEGCERQLSALGWRIVLRRHARSPH